MKRQHNAVKLLAVATLITASLGVLAPVEAHAFTINNLDGTSQQVTLDNEAELTKVDKDSAKLAGTTIQNQAQVNNGWVVPSGVLTSMQDIRLMKDGKVVTGWDTTSGGWRYYNSDGVMSLGWKQIESDWYYFNADGRMAQGTFINGYYINDYGKWDKSKDNSDGVTRKFTETVGGSVDNKPISMEEFAQALEQGRIEAYTKAVITGGVEGSELHFRFIN